MKRLVLFVAALTAILWFPIIVDSISSLAGFAVTNAANINTFLTLWGAAIGPWFLAILALIVLGCIVNGFYHPNPPAELSVPAPISPEVQSVLDREANNPNFRALNDPDYGKPYVNVFGLKLYI